ncbi:MAG: DNA mobilization endonuclease VirD1/MobC family subunit [Rhodobacterales bacterium]|nr:DNA mobilization endonuclease VirD1/MobC family subunit [Rhodobacterales bacterium]
MPSDAAPSSPAATWRSRKMRGGSWTAGADDEGAAPARVDRVVTVKMTEAELAELDAAIAPLGLKRNRALRIAARRIGGFVEAVPEEVGLLRDAVRQLGGIARNVNQIAKAANRTGDPDYRGFMEERAALGREIARLDARLQAVLDLAARRRDGLARLEAAGGGGTADGPDERKGAPGRGNAGSGARKGSGL